MLAGGGADAMSGGADYDVLRVSDLAFRRLDGGSGTDTLALAMAGVTLDLRAVSDLRLQDIKRVDLTGTGDNTLVLTALELRNLSTGSNTLRVLGNVGDRVEAGDAGWSGGGLVDGFRVFTNGTARLEVSAGVTAAIAVPNTAPSGMDAVLTMDEDTAQVLTADHFPFSDAEGHALAAVRIAGLPGVGALRLDGVAVVAGQVISSADLATGRLVFTPGPDASGMPYAATGVPGEISISFFANSRLLRFDLDGDGADAFAILLGGAPTLTSASFVL